MRTSFKHFVVSLSLLAVATTVLAHEYYAAGFTLVHPWADATEPEARDAPVYFRFEDVVAGDRLLGARTRFADRVELRMSDEAGAPALPAIDIAPAAAVEFGKGRPHLLLIGLKVPLQWGRSYDLTLEFERAGPMQVMVSIGTD